MTTIFLVRHGSFNRLGDNLDPPLTQRGVGEAFATAAWLADQSIDQVYASPLVRAKQTAEIIAAPQGLAVLQDARLRRACQLWRSAQTDSRRLHRHVGALQRRTDVGSASRRFVVRLR